MASPVFLSILIPVYNWDISILLKMLDKQCSLLSSPDSVEIIVIDDGSAQKFNNYTVAEKLPRVIYKELSENCGRAEVRNHLVRLSQGIYVLFLDADMLPDNEDFVQTYINLAKQEEEVVCGGISYKQYDPGDSKDSFHVYKSVKSEALPATLRNMAPWRYAFTSNIMLQKDILKSVSFDPRFYSYGFEDIEWAIRLEKSHKLEHVDNTCSHMGVIDKEKVFARMREAIDNHYLLYTLHPEKVGSAGAVGMAKYLRHLPDFLLFCCDKVITFLFLQLTWNRFLYLLFQGDKAILLAGRFKDKKPSRI